MAESTLSLTRTELLTALGRFMGWNRTTASWSASQVLDSEAILDKGLRQFYSPPILPGEATTHEWSWMKPIGSLTTVSGQLDYQLPDDFGGLCGDFTFGSDNSAATPLRLGSDERVRKLRQLQTEANTYPTWCAIVPMLSDGDEPQRFHLMLDHCGGEYRLEYRYYCNPYRMTSSKPYPLGGQPHSETLRASVLAAAELELDDKKDVRWQDFIERLQASVAHDRRVNATNFGYNGDRSGGSYIPRDRSQRVTFEGVSYLAE